MLVFVAYLTQLYGPIRSLGSLANTFFKAVAGAERVIELLDERPRVTERPLARPLARSRGEIEIEGLAIPLPGKTTLTRSTTSACVSPPARPWRWSAPAARESRRSPACSSASTTPTTGASDSTATICAT